MERGFEIGDDVYCEAFGRGKIVSLRQDLPFPNIVDFNGTLQGFTKSGNYFSTPADQDNRYQLQHVKAWNEFTDTLPDNESPAAKYFSTKANSWRDLIIFVTGYALGTSAGFLWGMAS